MGRFEVRPPRAGDIAVIANGMRLSDKQEIWAASRLTPHEGLELALKKSPDIWVGTWEGRPIGMAGCFPGSLLGGVGYPWQLATPEIEAAALPYLRASKPCFAGLRRKYRLLVNWVDVRNEKSIKWMKYLGFEIEDPAPYGVDGLPFHYAWMRGEQQ